MRSRIEMGMFSIDSLVSQPFNESDISLVYALLILLFLLFFVIPRNEESNHAAPEAGLKKSQYLRHSTLQKNIPSFNQPAMRVSPQKYCVYIITNIKKTVLYTGVTNSLEQRLVEHYLDRGKTNSFTSKYHAYHLLYYESFDYVKSAIAREKEIKGWSRSKKEALIAITNPNWNFLNIELFGEWPPKEMYHRRDDHAE